MSDKPSKHGRSRPPEVLAALLEEFGDLARLGMFEARLSRMQRVIDAAVCETRAEQALKEMMDKVNRAHELRAAEVRDYIDWLHKDST